MKRTEEKEEDEGEMVKNRKEKQREHKQTKNS